jgi:hypothetical protein
VSPRILAQILHTSRTGLLAGRTLCLNASSARVIIGTLMS